MEILISAALEFFITQFFSSCFTKYWYVLPESGISQGLIDAHAQTFVYISS